jgi:hypothetical protein
MKSKIYTAFGSNLKRSLLFLFVLQLFWSGNSKAGIVWNVHTCCIAEWAKDSSDNQHKFQLKNKRSTEAQWKQSGGPMGNEINFVRCYGDTFYAGTKVGLYVSYNKCMAWEKMDEEFLEYVYDIVQYSGKLFAATRNGIYSKSLHEHVWVNCTDTVNPLAQFVSANGSPILFPITKFKQLVLSRGVLFGLCKDGFDLGEEISSFDGNMIQGTFYGASFLLYSTNQGQTWNTLNTKLIEMAAAVIKTSDNFEQEERNLTIFHIVSDEQQNLYVQTNLGLFKTEDAGKKWTMIDLKLKIDGEWDFEYPLTINGSYMILPLRNSCLISLDGGKNWLHQNAFLVNYPNSRVAYRDFKNFHFSGKDFYARFDEFNDSVFVSRDEGKSWSFAFKKIMVQIRGINNHRILLGHDEDFNTYTSAIESYGEGQKWQESGIGLYNFSGTIRHYDKLLYSSLEFLKNEKWKHFPEPKSGKIIDLWAGEKGIFASIVQSDTLYGIYRLKSDSSWIKIFPQNTYSRTLTFLHVNLDSVFVYNSETEDFVSNDAGLTWLRRTLFVNTDGSTNRYYLGYKKVIGDSLMSTFGNILFVQKANGYHAISSNWGKSFRKLDQFLSDSILDIKSFHSHICAIGKLHVYVSHDMGLTWKISSIGQTINPILQMNDKYSVIANSDRKQVSFFISTDFGDTWRVIKPKLTLIEDRRLERINKAITGVSWRDFSYSDESTPDMFLGDIFIIDNILYAYLYGNSVWKLDLKEALLNTD